MVKIQPMYLLFRIGGFQPKDVRADLFFTLVSGCFQVFVWSFLIYSSSYDMRRLSTYVNISVDVLFWISGIVHLAKVHYTKKDFRILDSNLNNTANYGSETFVVLEISTTIAILVLLWMRMAFRSLTWFRFLQGLLSDLGTLVNYIPLIQQSMMIHQLTAKFSAVNDQLTAVAKVPANDARAELSFVLKTYNNLKDIVDQVNSYFAVFNFFSLTSRLFGLAFLLYYVFTALDSPGVGFVWSPFAVCMSIAAATIYHLEICYRCSSEVRHLRNELKSMYLLTNFLFMFLSKINIHYSTTKPYVI